MCWFDLAASFPAMVSHLHYSTSDLGLLATAFLLGAGIFQVPAGVYSAHRGATQATLIGLFVIGTTSLASAFSVNLYLQTGLRFFTGFGAAFFFAPALIVVSNTLGEKRSGLTLGLYNGAFNVGAWVAIFFFTQISASINWNVPFLITGALSLACFFENFYAFKTVKEEVKIDLSRAKKTLLSKDIWALILGIVGVSAAYYTLVNVSVTYSQNHLGFNPALAGTVSSLVLVGAIFGSPTGGFVADKLRNRRLLIMIPAIGFSLVISLLALPGNLVIWFVAPFAGFCASMAFTNSFTFATQYPEIGRKYAPLAVGLINSMGILEGGIVTAIFAPILISANYSMGWIVLALSTIIFGPLVYLAREPFSTSKETEETKESLNR